MYVFGSCRDEAAVVMLNAIVCVFVCLPSASYEEDVVIMIARLQTVVFFDTQLDSPKISRLAFMVLHKLAVIAHHVSINAVSLQVYPVGRSLCRGKVRVIFIEHQYALACRA